MSFSEYWWMVSGQVQTFLMVGGVTLGFATIFCFMGYFLLDSRRGLGIAAPLLMLLTGLFGLSAALIPVAQNDVSRGEAICRCAENDDNRR